MKYEEFEDHSLTGFAAKLISQQAMELMTVNPAFQEASLLLERSLISQWAKTDDDDSQGRERAYMKLRLLNELLSELDHLYSEGIADAAGSPVVN